MHQLGKLLVLVSALFWLVSARTQYKINMLMSHPVVLHSAESIRHLSHLTIMTNQGAAICAMIGSILLLINPK